MHLEELWTADTFKARLLRALLTPTSWLYALGWQSYLGIYRLGLKKPKEPHVPVVCIGNLLTGGTGKTPVTIHVADILAGLGRKVVISCSGYGSPASEAAQLAPEGCLKASEWGDEAALIRWLRPFIPLIVGRRRVLSAELCHRHFADAVLLLDDGFQHLPLSKHLTILLDPPQSNRRCLPAGPYREPRGNNERADLAIHGIGDTAAGFEIARRPMTFQTPAGQPRSVEGTVSILCALARPQGFVHALKAMGLTSSNVVLKPDHDPLADGNLLSGFPSGSPIIVTGKDWVKLRERPDVERYDVAIASYEVTIEPHDEFKDWLQKKLNGIANKED
ncbi:MAG: tetraacyldisaccharide 4'-kinase [Fimbriimonadales bacterium]